MPEPPLSLPNLDDIPDPLPAGTPDVALPPAAKPASPGPTRSDVSRARRLALVVGSGWVLGQLAIAGLRPDLARVPLGYTLGLAVVPKLPVLSPVPRYQVIPGFEHEDS